MAISGNLRENINEAEAYLQEAEKSLFSALLRTRGTDDGPHPPPPGSNAAVQPAEDHHVGAVSRLAGLAARVRTMAQELSNLL